MARFLVYLDGRTANCKSNVVSLPLLLSLHMDWKLLLSLLMSLFLWHCEGWVTADDTVGWCLYFRVSCYLTYEVVFKVALNESVKNLMSLVPERILTYDRRTFVSPKKWVICFLGSLRGISNFDGTSHDPFVNIIIVCITNEHISDE